MTIIFSIHAPLTDELFAKVGLIPSFLSEADARPAKEQFHDRYSHGGGWNKLEGWKRLAPNSMKEFAIKYPGDTWLYPSAQCQLRDETICIYPHAWVGIFQPDG